MDGLWLNGGPIGDADVRTMCETRLNEKQCARRENRDSCYVADDSKRLRNVPLGCTHSTSSLQFSITKPKMKCTRGRFLWVTECAKNLPAYKTKGMAIIRIKIKPLAFGRRNIGFRQFLRFTRMGE
uniref:Uncharacterized protein n=1 Tax=Caenorhabditis japonica TaxID=281687 RepID=A0A8R1E6Z3_CAEJA